MYSIHKNSIEDYYNPGELLEVMRDNSPSAGFEREIDFPVADNVGSE